jgi:4-hydroxybenzoate polyprenyltransferase
VYGPNVSVLVILISLVASFVLGLGLVFLSPLQPKGVYLLGAAVSGLLFLLLPLRSFVSASGAGNAIHLFNQASLYPVGILSTTVLCILVQYI